MTAEQCETSNPSLVLIQRIIEDLIREGKSAVAEPLMDLLEENESKKAESG